MSGGANASAPVEPRGASNVAKSAEPRKDGAGGSPDGTAAEEDAESTDGMEVDASVPEATKQGLKELKKLFGRTSSGGGCPFGQAVAKLHSGRGSAGQAGNGEYSYLRLAGVQRMLGKDDAAVAEHELYTASPGSRRNPPQELLQTETKYMFSLDERRQKAEARRVELQVQRPTMGSKYRRNKLGLPAWMGERKCRA